LPKIEHILVRFTNHRINSFSKFPNLKVIDFGGEVSAGAISKSKDLEYLSVGRYRLTKYSFLNNPNIKSIEISDPIIEDPGWLDNLPIIESISLNNLKLSDFLKIPVIEGLNFFHVEIAKNKIPSEVDVESVLKSHLNHYPAFQKISCLKILVGEHDFAHLLKK